ARMFPRPFLAESMLFGFFRQKKHNRQIMERQYAALTAAARTPYFYSDLSVPDTVMGRLEMLSIVLILFFRRTAKSARSGQELAQEIIDAFFQDVDHSIRELGVGDPGVPKRMKKLAGRFYGRAESYGAALDKGDGELLAQALTRNIYPERGEDAPDMHGLARWMIEEEAHLRDIPEESVETGSVTLAVPGGPRLQ
ncbi:MAG: ubiquinol-cytochrome C chaperone family protein, partial [Rhizobiaceae bacterium]|nr:ubiquinol-cytochrome C chaperone family protein [Rhizobiaceae bacterium]